MSGGNNNSSNSGSSGSGSSSAAAPPHGVTPPAAGVPPPSSACAPHAHEVWQRRLTYEGLGAAEASLMRLDPLPPAALPVSSLPPDPRWQPDKLTRQAPSHPMPPAPASSHASLLSSLRERIGARRSGGVIAPAVSNPPPPLDVLPPPTADDLHKQVHMGHEMMAGSIASVVSRFCVAPLDVLKIRFQIQEQASSNRQYTGVMQAFKTIYKTEGLRAFWKGNAAAELMVVPYGAVSFLAYSSCKSWFPLAEHAAGTYASYQHLSSLVAGSFAGICATISTYPLDLLRTRFAAQQQHKVYRSLWHAATHIVQREGIWGLYTGITPTLIGIVPLMALQFGSYEAFKQAIKNAHAEPGVDPNTLQLTFMQQSCAGFSAGAISKFLTMPLDVIKKRFQVSGFEIPHHLHVAEPPLTTAAAAAAATASAPLTPGTTAAVPQAAVADPIKPPPAAPPIPRSTPALTHNAPSIRSAGAGRAEAPLIVSGTPAIHSTSHLPSALGSSVTPPAAPPKQGVVLQVPPVVPVAAPSVSAAATAPPSAEPLIFRRPRRHDRPVSGRRPFTGVFDCARGIVSHEGVVGLFKGSVPSILKAGPNSAIIYMVYEYAIRWLNGEPACNTNTDKHKYKE